MRPLQKLSLLLLISNLLLISCTSKLSVTKRHYTKGYYIAHNKGTQTKQTKQSIETNSKLEKPSPAYAVKVLPDQKPALRAEKGIAPSPITAQAIPKSISTENRPGSLLKQDKNASQEDSRPLQLTTPLKDLRNIYLLEKSHNGESDGRGLSLFWVIILLILILWVLGYSAGWGTGGLINLLLLIALILFILWLLRVI